MRRSIATRDWQPVHGTKTAADGSFEIETAKTHILVSFAHPAEECWGRVAESSRLLGANGVWERGKQKHGTGGAKQKHGTYPVSWEGAASFVGNVVRVRALRYQSDLSIRMHFLPALKPKSNMYQSNCLPHFGGFVVTSVTRVIIATQFWYSATLPHEYERNKHTYVFWFLSQLLACHVELCLMYIVVLIKLFVYYYIWLILFYCFCSSY